MNAIKSATAGVKENVQNVKAKADQHFDLNKASSQFKTDMKSADTKAAKHEAKANYHTTQAQIHRDYEQKKVDNKAAKEEKRAALHQKKTDKKAGKGADEPADETGGVAGEDEQTPSTPATEENLDDTNTSPDAPEQASEAGEDMTDTEPKAGEDVTDTEAKAGEDVTDSNPDSSAADDSSAVPNHEVPMHGSGVPTHSELHGDDADNKHDARTTETMNGSGNTGSYM